VVGALPDGAHGSHGIQVHHRLDLIEGHPVRAIESTFEVTASIRARICRVYL
jgi:hypothetical protein